ncbi:hypothetical protein HOG98_00990 [bacterium]|jgi:U32 family peptidase|nr:hypothetical protein [bacterium]
MNIKTPSLSCYVSDKETIDTAYASHIDHLIIEDSKCSVRSFFDDFRTNNFDKIQVLADYARKTYTSSSSQTNHLNHELSLSFNIDLLAHEKDFDTIRKCVLKLKETKINIIRIQDPGLKTIIHDVYPEATIHFNQEIGNQNQQSVFEYTKHFDRQTLSLELPSSEIESIIQFSKTNGSKFEIQVQGPILIQYSYRQFLGNHDFYKDLDSKIISVAAMDHEYPGRKFHFYDNPHGHFMYLYFDRCLAQHIPALISLNLDTWLIDHRNRSLDYLKASGNLYFNALNDLCTINEDFDVLKKTCDLPLRGGFFRANKTDQDRKWNAGFKDDVSFLGTIVDSEKPNNCLFESFREFSLPCAIDIITPEDKHIDMTITELTTLKGDAHSSCQVNTLYLLPWKKGLVKKSKVFRKQISSEINS